MTSPKTSPLVRTQVQLTKEQHRKLRALAAARHLSLSQLIRESVEILLSAPDRSAQWRRLWEVVGAAEDPAGATDVAGEHDRYLAEIRARELGIR